MTWHRTHDGLELHLSDELRCGLCHSRRMAYLPKTAAEAMSQSNRRAYIKRTL